MLLWVFLLVPMVLAAERELKVNNYLLKIEDDILKSVFRTDDESTELNLSGLGLRSIENKIVFDNLDYVKILNLANNSLSTLPEFVFSNFTSLEDLSLAHNQIDKFQNAFVGLNNLKTLDISGNPIKHLRKGFFFGLSKSSNVMTRNNSFDSLSTELFENPLLRTGALPEEIVKEDSATETKAEAPASQKTKRWTTFQRAPPVFEKDLRIKICLQGDSVKSLEVCQKDETLTSDCNDVAVNHDTSSLSLEDLGIAKFEKGWYQLQDLGVSKLDLQRNNIVHVTSELLNDLPESIVSVNLMNNKIERLEKDIIENQHIQFLNLNGNFISEIEVGALEKTKLTGLSVSGNRLKDTKFVGTLPSTLIQMNLEKNALTELSVGSFSKLNQLVFLTVAENNITELKSESLSGLSSLATFIAVNSHLTKIEPNTFQDLKSLAVLDLTYNDITTLEKGVFTGLLNIERISIGHNRISKIEKEALHGLPESLDEFALNSNKLTTLEVETFVNVPKQQLLLQDNEISKIEKGVFNITDLDHLRLEGNALKTIDGDSFEGLSGLKHLYLRGNGITKIEKGAAKNLGSLYSLDISDNDISRLENGALFGLQKSKGCHLHLTGVPVVLIQGGLFDDV